MEKLDQNPIQYVIKHVIMADAGVLDSTEKMKKTEILREHRIWKNEKEGYWYGSIPDKTKKTGWKNVKRKKREDIEKVVVDAYIQLEKHTEEENEKENMSFESLFYEFIKYKKMLVKGATIKRMMADWKRFYVPHPEFIQKRFKDINKIDVDNFFNSIVNEHELHRKCFGNMCGIMKQTFEYAVDKEYTDKNPYRVNVSNKKIIPDRKKASREEVYNEEEEKLIREEMERRLANNPSNTAPLAVLLDFELGVRKGELIALKSTDIHDGYIHIGRQVVEKIDVADEHNIKGKGFVAVEYTKTESGIRDIPLTDRAKKIIERVININQKGGEYYQDFLFVRNGYLMSPDAIDAQIKRGCEYIGIQVKTMHKIRKTVASKLIENGVSVSATKDILGHADESTTLRYYIYDTDTQDENNKKVLNALGNGGESTRFNEYDSTNVRQREIKIIPFHKKEKAENPIKYKAFHS